MYNFCTYFDSNYISHGLSLFKSITKHSEEPINFYVLCLDEKTFQVLTDQKNKNLIPLKLRDIENEYSELLEAKKNRSRGPHPPADRPLADPGGPQSKYN